MSLELVGPRKLAHAAQIVAERAFEPLRQVVNQHVPTQPIFPFKSCWAML